MQYITGTVSTTAASTAVVGTGTLWLAALHAGSLIAFDGGTVFYEVATVTDDTHLTLTANYPDTLTNVDYVAVSDFTPELELPLVASGDLDFPEIYSRSMAILDNRINNLAPANTIRPIANVISALSDPPVSPTLGDRHIIIATATDVWATHEGQIAQWSGTNWVCTNPVSYNLAISTVNATMYYYTGTAWVMWAVTQI